MPLPSLQRSLSIFATHENGEVTRELVSVKFLGREEMTEADRGLQVAMVK